MKPRTYILLLAMIVASNVSGQTMIPAAKTFSPNETFFKKGDAINLSQRKTTAKLIDSSITQLNKTAINKMVDSLKRQLIRINTISPSTDTTKSKLKNLLQNELDKIKKNDLLILSVRQLDSVENKNWVDELVSQLNKTTPFSPIVTAGASNVETPGNLAGNLSAGVQFRLTDYKRIRETKWIDPLFAYVLFNVKTASSADTASNQKRFLFPEISKRDFVLGFFWEFQNINGWSISPTIEGSLAKYADTSKKTLPYQSYLLGVKMQKSFSYQNVNSFISFYPYFNVLTVDQKYDSQLPFVEDNKIPHTIYAMGLNVSAQTTHGILFCNMKYVVNTAKVKDPDLKTLVYTIGTLITL